MYDLFRAYQTLQIMSWRRLYMRLSPPLLHEGQRRSMSGDHAERIAFTQRHDAELGSANLYSIRQHGFKYGLKFAGRTRDDLQHLRSGGLLLQRLAQFAEQARILDGNDGLRGKVLQECDLPVGERLNLLAEDCYGPDQLIIFEHRDRQHRPIAGEVDSRANKGMAFDVGRYGLDVGDL